MKGALFEHSLLGGHSCKSELNTESCTGQSGSWDILKLNHLVQAGAEIVPFNTTSVHSLVPIIVIETVATEMSSACVCISHAKRDRGDSKPESFRKRLNL